MPQVLSDLCGRPGARLTSFGSDHHEKAIRPVSLFVSTGIVTLISLDSLVCVWGLFTPNCIELESLIEREMMILRAAAPEMPCLIRDAEPRRVGYLRATS